MPIEIEETNGLWKATHAKGRCGGPRTIACGDTDILADFCCSIDSVPDYLLHSKNAHVYHKAGQSVFESKGDYPTGQSLRQISRYAANAMRVTWDLSWPKATAPKDAVQIGNATLKGRWTRMFLLQQDGSGQWQELEPGREIAWQGDPPLAMVFEREDGVRLEYAYGFDLWRWEAGLGLANSTPLRVIPSEEGLQILRQVSDASLPPSEKEEAPAPQPRDYRFMATLAWSIPAIRQALKIGSDFESRATLLHYDSNGLLLNDVPDDARDFVIDLAEQKSLCMESDLLLSHLKRYIRQLAAFAPEGRLLFKGFSPKTCLEATHCAKKQPTLHWDHQALLTFAAWAKNCLGEGWCIDFQFPAPLNELPSLQFISLPNGFAYNEG